MPEPHTLDATTYSFEQREAESVTSGAYLGDVNQVLDMSRQCTETMEDKIKELARELRKAWVAAACTLEFLHRKVSVKWSFELILRPNCVSHVVHANAVHIVGVGP